MTGEKRTQQWIDRWQIKDSGERPHWPTGIWTSKARLTVYVLFDDFPRLGNRAWYFFTSSLQRVAGYMEFNKPIRGSHGEVNTKETGAGYLIEPKGGGVFIDRVEQFSGMTRDDPNTAVEIVMAQFRQRAKFAAVRPASKEEQQIKQIDFWVDDPIKRYGLEAVPIEVKSRGKERAYACIFLQLSETNPEKRR